MAKIVHQGLLIYTERSNSGRGIFFCKESLNYRLPDFLSPHQGLSFRCSLFNTVCFSQTKIQALHEADARICSFSKMANAQKNN